MEASHPALTALLALFIIPSSSSAVPVALPDSYALGENRTIVLGEDFGVLSNDTEEGTPTAILQSSVSNGVLTFNSDGSFTYTPDPDFFGSDCFTYHVLGSGGSQVFTVDQNNSNVTVNASVNVSGIGSDTDNDSSSVAGTVTAAATPSTAPFSELHISNLDVSSVSP